MHGWGQDLRFGLRTLRKFRLVTAVTIVSLALAIAGNVTIFSIISGLFFRPLPYAEPRRLVLVVERHGDDVDVFGTASAANFLDWTAENQVFQELAAFKSTRLDLTGGEETEPVAAAMVSSNFFHLVGRDAVHGRTFTADEGKLGNARVALLAHPFWKSRYGGNEGVIGRSLEIGEEAYTIVGVVPEDFEFLIPNVQVWLPLSLDPARVRREEKDLVVVARLQPGVSMAQARSAMAEVGERLAAQYPDANRGYGVAVVNLREEIPDDRNRRTFGLMQGAMSFVLLIACANVANLLLARGRDRAGELAIHGALGASRWRIARRLMLESLILAALASVLGLALAALLVRMVATMMAASLPSYYAPVIDVRVIVFTLFLGTGAGLLFGIAPALRSRIASFEHLREAARGQGAGRRWRLLANSLVVTEIAASAVLLAGAGMLIRGFVEMQNADPGFEMDRLLTVGLTIPEEERYADEQGLSALYTSLLERLDSVAGVKAAGLTNSPPRSPASPKASFFLDGMDPSQRPRAILLTTSPAYLETLQIPLIRGRFFSPADRDGALPVAVISQALARRHWPGQDPLGRSLTVNGLRRQIVGIVGNVRQEVALGDEEQQIAIYVPLAQQPAHAVTALLRTAGDPYQVAKPVREAILGVDPKVTILSVLTLDEYVAQFLVGARVFALLLGGFGSFALFLAAIGIYGVLAYAVAQRSHEIGVRMALGARREQVLRMVAAQGLRLALIGFVLAVPGVIGLSRVISSVLAGLTVVRTSSILLAGSVLLLAVLAASILPARRASRVDPAIALRSA